LGGPIVNYSASGVGSVLSRLDNIADDASGTQKYSSYTYLGASTVISVAGRVKTGQ
jgi:hypothetical protein